jgi:hypothetical protein
LKRSYHNWNHVHRGLQELGFKKVSTYSDFLYYEKDDKKVVLEKSNRIDRVVIEKICGNIGISYDVFVESYMKAYSRDLRRYKK